MIKLTEISLGIALGLAISATASAQVITWSGATDANWATATNWVGDVAPVAGDSLIFTGSGNVNSVNNLAPNTAINGIIFNSGAANNFVLTGSVINLSGTIGNLRNTTSASNPAINNNLALQSTVTVDVPTSGVILNLGGQITGAQKISKIGSGIALFNNATSTFSGGLDVLGGIARSGLGGNSTTWAGTGAITLDGGTVEFRSTGGPTFNNALVVGANGGTVRGRTHTFAPSSLTGTGTLTLFADSGQVITPTTFQNFGGTIDVRGGMRLGTNYVQGSGVNAALQLNTGGSHTRQNGTNQTTSLIEFGSLSGVTGTTFGGSAVGTGVFNYQIGSLNTNTNFAGSYNDGGTRTSLIKVGTGSLTLSGAANTFSGPSRVDAGSLVVDGALSSAALTLGVNNGGSLLVGSSGSIAGTVNVNTGGTLGGSGSLAGPVNVIGGTLAPGTSPGTLSINNALILDSNSFLAFELNGQNTTIGGGINDLLNSITNLTLDGTLNISETTLNSFSTAANNSTWRLINYTGTLTDNGLTLGSTPTLPSGGNLSIDTSIVGQVNLVLTATAIPEPSSIAVISAALGLVGYARRRRSKSAESIACKDQL